MQVREYAKETRGWDSLFSSQYSIRVTADGKSCSGSNIPGVKWRFAYYGAAKFAERGMQLVGLVGSLCSVVMICRFCRRLL